MPDGEFWRYVLVCGVARIVSCWQHPHVPPPLLMIDLTREKSLSVLLSVEDTYGLHFLGVGARGERLAPLASPPCQLPFPFPYLNGERVNSC